MSKNLVKIADALIDVSTVTAAEYVTARDGRWYCVHTADRKFWFGPGAAGVAERDLLAAITKKQEN
jgi:hypothetical protein